MAPDWITPDWMAPDWMAPDWMTPDWMAPDWKLAFFLCDDSEAEISAIQQAFPTTTVYLCFKQSCLSCSGQNFLAW